MGSGKSTVAKILRDRGFTVLDADQVVHLLLSPGGAAFDKVTQTFGPLERRALGRVVFADPAKLVVLEQILHPLVREHVRAERARLAATGQAAAFYDVPLLFEKKMEADFDAIIVVTATPAQRRARLATRSQMTEAEFLERSKHHVAPELKVARATAVIHNNDGLHELSRAVDAVLAQLNLPTPA